MYQCINIVYITVMAKSDVLNAIDLFDNEVINKFMSKIVVRDVMYECYDQCWIFPTKRKDKRPVFNIHGKIVYAYRYAFALFKNNKVFPEKNICHKCDIPRCVSPHHLFEGTDADNVADMVSKNRQAKGEDMWNNCKLSREKVKEIREYLKVGRFTQSEIALIFNVNNSLIGKIKIGKIWKHV